MPTKTFTQFRKDSVVTSIPTSLPYGEEAYYKDSNGRLTLYVGDESGDAQLAVPSDFPARVVNVFGGAPNVAPNYDTVAGAITYANSLTPTTANPVVIRLFSKADNTPYDLTGQNFYTLNASGIYIQSAALGYIDAPVVTVLPTTLERGRRVWYKDGNGNFSQWIGNESGVAQVVDNSPIAYSFAVSGSFADLGTISFSSNMTASKSGKLVTVNAGLAYSIPQTPDWQGLFTITTGIPTALYPQDGALCNCTLGLPELGLVQKVGFWSDGEITFNINETDMIAGSGVLRISASFYTD